jgi:probable selenium-dependent hydroxylase accessory protein YqeC
MTKLYELLDINPGQRELVCFVGAGGKTSSMFALAQELKAAGKKVLVTTTTAIFYPQRPQYDEVIVSEEAELDIDSFRAAEGITVLGRERTQENKLLGMSPEFIDALYRQGPFDHILVEGDGSKGRPVKAPAGHEPVIPPTVSKVIGLIGLDCLDKPVEEEHVHRPEIFRSFPGCDKGSIDVHMLASLITHENGLFKDAPADSSKYLILNKSELEGTAGRGDQLAAILAEERADIRGIILASMRLHTYVKL